MLTPLNKKLPLLNPTSKCSPWCLWGQFVQPMSFHRFNLFPIGPAVWPHFTVFWIVDPIKPPKMPPWGIVGELFLAYVHSQMNPQTCTKFGANRSSRLTASRDFWMFDPEKPLKCPLVSLGAICLAYIYSQMNLHMCTNCFANRISRLIYSPNCWIGDPLPPPPPQCRGANCI